MNHLDLFSGIGGFALAAQWAGIETVGFCEIDPFCRQVLQKHWPDVIKHADIKDLINPEQVDIITAGFPCQPFSVAGKRKGKEDERYLWPEVIRIIKQSKPTWFIGENVPGIIPMLDPILNDLENEGYNWVTYLIPASLIGAPHKRERLWIIAHSDSKRCDDGVCHRKERHPQDNWQPYLAKIQSEWSQFIPKSWTTFNAQEWLGFASNTNSESGIQGAANQEAITERLKRSQSTGKDRNATANPQPIFNWEEDKPPIPGVDDGLPQGVDRNKSLGNAIIPQIPFVFMSLIQSMNSL